MLNAMLNGIQAQLGVRQVACLLGGLHAAGKQQRGRAQGPAINAR
jgi:hypothetical protein